MVTQTKTVLCPRCGKPALSDHGEPYCMTHGPISPAPISEPKGSKHNTDGQTPGARKGQLTVNPDFEAALGESKKPAETKELPIPPRPATKSRTAIHEYYETNKPRILADHQRLGAGAAIIWSIPRSQYDKLIKLWTGSSPGRQTAHTPKSKKSESPPPQKLASKLVLPALPSFNPGWPMDMQGCWLEIYEILVSQEAAGNGHKVSGL